MSVGGHGRQVPDKGIHTPISWVFADAAARTAFTPTEGLPLLAAQLTVADLYKAAYQVSDQTIWLLTGVGPAVWTAWAGGGGGGMVAHALGGAFHTASTLAALNALITDAVLDDSGDPRPPTAHALGGAAHSSSTLAALNALVSDAVLGGLTASAPADVTKSSAAVGTATDVARADHKHNISTGTPGATQAGDAAAEGTATSLTRSDHVHSVAVAAPVAIGASNAAGVATTFVRSDHVHAHGDQAGGTLHANATTSVAGFLSGSDKTKLDSITAGAAPVTASAPVDVTKAAAVVGVATDAARADHKHDISTAVPGATQAGASATEGSSSSLARSDHAHSVAVAAPVSIGATNAAGVATTFVRSDHVHAHGDQAGGSLHSDATTSVSGFLSGSDKTKLDGIATSAAALTSTAPADVTKAAASVGVGTTAARHDHKHDISTASPGATQAGDAAAEGTATSLARSDHAHSVAIATPVAIGTANAAGSATTFVRSDHVHAHGAQAGGALHAQVTTSVDGFMIAADKTKLDGIATGAAALTSTPPANVDRSASVVGVGTTAARHDHKHDIAVAAPGAIAVGNSASTGSSSSLAAADHVHSVARGTPVDIGTANSGGAASTFAAGDHVHNLPFATVQTVLGTATSAVSFNNQRLTGVATPSSASDAANKSYVDDIASGLDPKGSVTALSNANIVALSGLATTVDSISLNTIGMRVLLTAQGTASQNGIWVIQSGAWTRPTDFATGSNVASAYCFVEQGTSYGDTGWVCTSDSGSAVVDADNLAFTQFSSSGAGVTAGAGLTLTGIILDVGAHADGSIVVNANDVQVGVLATDAQHGNRGGGSLHANVVAAGAAGFMTGADKTKLDGVAASAAALTSSAPVDVTKAAAVVGVASTAARADHKHDVSTAAPGASGVATASGEGSATSLARSDHTHQSNTAPVNVTKATAAIGTSGEPARADHKHDVSTAVAGATQAGDAAAEGTATSLARSDHVHSVAVASPVAIGTANASGSASTFVRSDHVHAHGAQTDGTLHADATTSVSGFLSSTDKTKLDGIATGAAALTSTAPVDVTKAAASVGVGTTAARHDHKHDVSTAVAGAIQAGDAAAEGTATSLARSDHAHSVAVATPSTIGTANASGSATTFVRSDHVHAHGAQTDGSLHAAVTTSVNGFMSAADKTKLDAIPAGSVGQIQYHNGAGGLGAEAGFEYDSATDQATIPGLTLTQDLFYTGVISPTALASNTNDYAPTGFSTASVVRLTASAAVSLTGLAGGSSGRYVVLHNVGSNNIDLIASSGSSSAANQFLFPFNLTLAPNQSIAVYYDGASSRWRVAGGTGNAVFRKVYGAYDFFSPTSNAAVNAFAAVATDSLNAALVVRRFDDTTQEGVTWGLTVPVWASNINFFFKSRAQTAPGGAVGVKPVLYFRTLPDNAAVGSWSAGTQLATLSFPTNTNWQYDVETVTLATLSLTPGTFVQFELTRLGTDGADTLSGDWTLLEMTVEFS